MFPACSPTTAATPSAATSAGSSPKFSSLRPKRGSVGTFSSGLKPRSVPVAEASAAITAAMDRTSSALKEAPWEAGMGKITPALAPWSVSWWKLTGMWSRELFIRAPWNALRRAMIEGPSVPS